MLPREEIPKVRPKTLVRFSREQQTYSVHYSDYEPLRQLFEHVALNMFEPKHIPRTKEACGFHPRVRVELENLTR